ncbi:MAG: cyclase family protein [Lachnospiraceae bacterium]|nr:cyclase family protein [Lachnospiraceae bacterium]
MRIYDISQEVFGCVVFPGDPAPRKEIMLKISEGDICNLSSLHMCAHNGTHVDAPYHFLEDGKKIDEVALEKFIGMAYVADHEGIVTAEDAGLILQKAKAADERAVKKILIKGRSVISYEAAEVFEREGIELIGNESQTVGPEDAPKAVHLRLLGSEVVLLEGIRLSAVPEGVYFLNAAPINLGGADGAPCRAVLVEL